MNRSEEYQAADVISSPACQDLLAYVGEALQRPPEAQSLEEFERGLREKTMALEAQILARQVERFDVEAEEIEVEGQPYRLKMKSKREYCGLSGTFTVERNLFVPRSREGKAIAPLDLRAGIVESTWTPLAARAMALAVQGSTPREAARVFEELGGMKPSTSSLDRMPKSLSAKWEEKREEFESELRSGETIPEATVTVTASMDAVTVPIKNAGRAEKRSREDKLPQGPAGYKHVGCGEISYYDADGERLETYRYGRMPERAKVTLRSSMELELAVILEARPDVRVAALADGAAENWAYFAQMYQELGLRKDQVVEILDFYHAVAHVKRALDAFYGEANDKGKAMFEECRLWLREYDDGVERVIRALRYRANQASANKCKAIEREISFLKKRKDRMRYKRYLNAKLPIGTGVIEATCKTLATERMKRSGMSWLNDGGQAILTLRSLVQSEDRWGRAWELLANEYRSPVIVTAKAA